MTIPCWCTLTAQPLGQAARLGRSSSVQQALVELLLCWSPSWASAAPQHSPHHAWCVAPYGEGLPAGHLAAGWSARMQAARTLGTMSRSCTCALIPRQASFDLSTYWRVYVPLVVGLNHVRARQTLTLIAQVVRASLVVDFMGGFSPVSTQARAGASPDSVMVLVSAPHNLVWHARLLSLPPSSQSLCTAIKRHQYHETPHPGPSCTRAVLGRV
jgi:hypothetical protein